MQEYLTPTLILEGQFVKLSPLKLEHENALIEAASDGELWNLNYTSVPSPKTAKNYIEEALKNMTSGNQFPFVIQRLSDQKIVGCTRFYDIEKTHRNLAIGYTWYAESAQRTVVNTATKLLLLSFAFETLNCVSVAFHTDHLNSRSQAAIARLGASKEGVLRNHRIMPDGRIRHTWCFSIIDAEWPGIKENLQRRLAS